MSDDPRDPEGAPSNDLPARPTPPSMETVPVFRQEDIPSPSVPFPAGEGKYADHVKNLGQAQSLDREPSAAETRAMALVALMTDGDLAPEERDELRAIFQANPDLLQTYVEQAVAHAMLEWRYVRMEDDADLQGVESSAGAAASDAPQSFEVHGQLSLRPLCGGSGISPTLPAQLTAQFPTAPRRRFRRGPLLAAGFVAGAALVAALFLWAPWSQNKRENAQTAVAPPEPRQPAVYVGFDTWSALGGTFRKQLNPKMVTWTPKGLRYRNLACSGGALKIDATHDQFLWLDLDSDLVISPERNTARLSRVVKDRGPDVAWPGSVPMGTPGTTLYMSFLIRAEQPIAFGLCGIGFFYGADSPSGSLFVGKARGIPGFSYDFAGVRKTLLDADPTALSTRPIPLDTNTHLIVTRVDFREGEDRFAIYFDPDPNLPEPKQPNGTGIGKIALDRLRISAGRGMDPQGGAVWYLDEIRLGDHYRAVVPLAEDVEPSRTRASQK
jgi:hypothetical protein